MGYALFTQSGTFNPSDYGLNIGDVLQVTCVGGGASGCGNYVNKAGTASSFGSFVTAAGGNANTSATVAAAPLANQRAATGGDYNHTMRCIDTSSYTTYQYVGSCGAPGWMPSIGLIPYPAIYFDVSMRPGYISGSSNGTATYASALAQGVLIRAQSYGPQEFIAPASSLCAAGANYAGSGATLYSPYSGSSSKIYSAGIAPGGYGYGAGGGGYCENSTIHPGGNSGAVIDATLKLASISAIAVTVGIGGASVLSSNTSGNAVSGAGAPGCVAVFW